MVNISFVLPAYKAKFLKQAIQSILDQSYEHFELIIVNDASPDNIEDIVFSFNDKRILYYRNEQNIGGTNLVSQWNHCINYAQGEFLVLAADDDLYHPDYLEKCVALTKKYPHINLIRSRVDIIDENNNLIGLDGILPEYCSKYQYFYYWLNATAFTCIGNFMFRTTVLKEKQFIDFPQAFGSDTASTIMMSENGMANTSEALFYFRISSIHLSSNKGKLMEKLEANTLLFKWLRGLTYKEPMDRYDKYCFDHTSWSYLYQKCKYDYYNLVIKYLPFAKYNTINKCELLTKKDRRMMFVRFCFNKLWRKV